MARAMSRHRSSSRTRRERVRFQWLLRASLALAGAFLLFLQGTAFADTPSSARQQVLTHMVRQECGSCHGMSLQGGLGPSLLPGALSDKSVEGLVATIYAGRPGTAMPPWQRFLSEDEAQWIVEQLMHGFPK